jgi:hypothetical protein
MRRRTWVVMFASLTILGASPAATAHAAAPAEWQSLQRDIAAPYPAMANAQARFPDYVNPRREPWSNPMLGLALIQAGLKQGNAEQVDTGLRTITEYVAHRPRTGEAGVFDHFAVASAYNLMREAAPENPRFIAHKPRWEAWLRRQPLHWLPNTNHYANKYMVEVVAVLEFRRSGLSSQVSASALAQGDRAEGLALSVLDDVAPALAQQASTTVAGAPAFVLSDPSNDALAYQALTLGFFARAVDLLGPRASVRAREALQRVARASWALTAPDGDLAYIGRSQEQGWALALTAYGAEVAADDADATWAPRFRAVADRAMARLRAAHGVGPHGLWITPSGAGAGAASGRRGLDTYAHGPGYGGLALVGVNWAVEHAERGDRAVAEIASDSPSATQLGRGRTVFHAVRAQSSWFAVKRSRSNSGSDLRYDFGLVALKRPMGDGGWYDIVRARPHTTGRGDSAGPVLLGRGGRALPDGVRSGVSADGTVTVRGGYRSPRGPWLSRGETFRFAPVDCGIRATFTRRRGGILEYSVFFRDRPAVSGGRLTAPGIAVDASPQPAVRLSGGYSSGVDARLTRAVLRFPAGRAPVQITICGA